MVAITCNLVVLSQPFTVHDTQYPVVVFIEGVVKGLPVPIEEPPLDRIYHVKVPAQPVASSVTVPGPQLVPSTAVVGAEGIVFTVAVTVVRVADIQPVVVFLVCA